jgi:hypothetical protein
MKIIIIDGQGGKLGKILVEQLKQAMPEQTLIAIGTNTIATLAMLKAGATHGATGENPVVYNCATADIIVGPIGIIKPNALLGEITPTMAAAVGNSPARKILIPMVKCDMTVVGVQDLSLTDYTQLAVEKIVSLCQY